MPADLDLSAAQDAASQSIDTSASAAGSAAATQVDAGASGTAASSPPPAASVASSQSQPAGTQQQQAEWSLRSQLQQLGMQGQWQDDKQAWEALAGQLRQQQQQYAAAQQYAAYYLANKQRIETALAAPQQQAAAQPAKSGDEWWSPPEWNEQWQQFLRTDEKGNVVPVMGADPSLGLKYQAHQAWQRDTFNKLTRDPIGTLKPGLDKLIEEKTQELIQKHLRGYDDRQYAQQYVTQQSDWMYAKAPNGQILSDSFGQRMLSPAGQKFAGYVRQAEAMGIQDTRQQQQFAESMTQKDALTAFWSQHNQQGGNGQAIPNNAAAQNDALKNQAIRGGARRLPNSGAQGGAGPATQVGDAQPRDIRLGFGDRLNKRLKEAGLTEVV